MAELLNLCADDVDICVNVGDTKPFQFERRVNGAVIDITGFTYVLSVDPDSAPESSSTQLFQLTGSVVDGPNGIVEFAMNASQSDQNVDVFFYDIQETDGAADITIASRGKYEFEARITGTP